MLTREENQLLTGVGPGSPMGDLLRRYWMPALLSSEVAAPNCDPVRVQLAGENFVAWRDAAGRLGFFDEFCMHRGASLALGRCEGDGLRCIFHGWKFATDGKILETPNYHRSTVRDKLRAPVYPVREAGGLVWVYLGPAGKEPAFPHYKFFDEEAEHLPIYDVKVRCSWVQAMEGSLDSSHTHILHVDVVGTAFVQSAEVDETLNAMNKNWARKMDESFVSEDLAPTTDVEDTTFGLQGVFVHNAVSNGRNTKYGRAYAWVLPFLTRSTEDSFAFFVPMEEGTMRLFAVDAKPIPDRAERERYLEQVYAGPASHYDEDGWYRWGADARWGQERWTMRNGSFSGIKGILPEDNAMSLSMGPVYDRTRENLVPADLLIIRMRRRLLEAARNLAEGREPHMPTPEETHAITGGSRLLPDPTAWQQTIVPNNEPFRLPGPKEEAPVGAE
jgi:phthalate 4,5-dioxygenase